MLLWPPLIHDTKLSYNTTPQYNLISCTPRKTLLAEGSAFISQRGLVNHSRLTGGGDADGGRDFLAKDVGGSVHLTNVSQDPGAEAKAVEGRPSHARTEVQANTKTPAVENSNSNSNIPKHA